MRKANPAIHVRAPRPKANIHCLANLTTNPTGARSSIKEPSHRPPEMPTQHPNPKRTRDPSQYIPELKNNTATPLVKCFANKSNHGSEFAQMRLQSLPCALTQTREQLQRRSTHHVALAAACAHHEIVCSLCCVSDTRMNSGKLILCLESFNTISLEKG